MTYAEMLQEAALPPRVQLNPGPGYAADRRVFQGIPAITATPGGRLWAAWYSGGQGESPLNYALLATSGDGGETWSEPVLVIDPPGKVRASDPLVWCAPDGRLWLFWCQAHTLQDGRAGVWAIIADDAENPQTGWSKPRRLTDGVMLCTPTVTRSGDCLLPISTLGAKYLENENRMIPPFLRTGLAEFVPAEEKQAIDNRAGAHVYRLEGDSVIRLGTVQIAHELANHNEHMLVEKTDGSLWMLFRTVYGIAQSFSRDGGHTWSEPVPTGWPHPASRFSFSRLRSGSILLIKHGLLAPLNFSTEKSRLKRDDLRAFLSTDDGLTWQGGLSVERRHCSYPCVAELPDGKIVCIYDHERRDAKEVLLARFHESDVLAGADGAIEHFLVNKASGVITPEEDWAQWKNGNERLIFTGI